MGNVALNVILSDLGKALSETALMVSVSLVIAVLLGLPLGFLLFLTRRGMLLENRWLNFVGGLAINFVRSLPFVILLILVLPLSLVVTGKSTGPIAATVPLTIACLAFYARLVEVSLCEVNAGVIEAARALGAPNGLIIREVLFPESLPGLVRGLTVTAVSLIGYSAMAGVVGGGGVGFLAINYGYYRYETGVMVITIVVLILIVQLVQWTGDAAAARLERPRR
jgi:D-methionine transport system permease protein